MFGQVVTVIVTVVLIALAAATTFVLGMRAKSPLVQRPVVWFSKRFINPRQMRTAGTPGAYASIIRTVGRKSGTAYATPVTIVADGDDLVVALPYGTRPNWLQNALAAGSATVVHEGATIAVDRPEVVPIAEAAACFTPSDLRSFRVMNVDRCVRLHRAGVVAAA